MMFIACMAHSIYNKSFLSLFMAVLAVLLVPVLIILFSYFGIHLPDFLI